MKKLPLVLAVSLLGTSLVACGSKNNNSNFNNQTFVSEKEQQYEFEKNYCEYKGVYADGGKFALSVLSNIGTIAAGCYFESPTVVVSGIIGLVNSVCDHYGSEGSPTTADIMNKLNEMDTKIDAINSKLDENYNQLSVETARIEAMVDQVLLADAEKALSDFNTNYVVKIEDYNRSYSDYLDQSYKEYVSKTENAEITIYKNDDGKWTLNPISEPITSDMTTLNIELKSFQNSLTYLEKNYNAVGNGFIDRLEDDINENLEGVNLPKGLDATTCRQFIEGNLIENFTKKFYVENHDKAQQLNSLVINYAKQISGKGVKSIVDHYYNRLRFMYNFAGEMKEPLTGLLANLKYNLMNYAGLAAQACLFAESSQSELKTEFEAALKVVEGYYDNIKDVDNRYCFITGTKLTGDFYGARFETWYSNYGNHPVFHSNLRLDKIDDSKYNGYTIDDFSNHKNVIDSMDNSRLAMRYQLMKEIGVTKSETYVKYMVDAGIINQRGYDTYVNYLKKNWLTDDAYRVFTGLNVRAMNDGDKSLKMTCKEKGNPDGDYFYVGWRGNYKGAYEAGCWSGTIAETTFMDGYTGKPMSNKTVCAFANYAESHTLWIDDEYASFVDNTVSNFFFMIENA